MSRVYILVVKNQKKESTIGGAGTDLDLVFARLRERFKLGIESGNEAQSSKTLPEVEELFEEGATRVLIFTATTKKGVLYSYSIWSTELIDR